MFTWKCAVDEMYVTSLPVNYPLKNTSIVPTLYTFGESASVTQFAYRMRFPTNLHKMCKNKNIVSSHVYRLFTFYSPIQTLKSHH